MWEWLLATYVYRQKALPASFQMCYQELQDSQNFTSLQKISNSLWNKIYNTKWKVLKLIDKDQCNNFLSRKDSDISF